MYWTKSDFILEYNALFNIHVVLVRLRVKFSAMFESGNMTRYNGPRLSAVRKEILCWTIKFVYKASARICLSSLTGLVNVILRLCGIAATFFWCVFSSTVLFDVSNSLMCTAYTFFYKQYNKMLLCYRVRIILLFFICTLVWTSAFQLLRRRVRHL